MKNIIFDLGGVIINIDYNLTIAAFKKLGVKNFGHLYSQAQQDKLFDKFEMGKITPREFRNEVKKLLPDGITNFEIDRAWCAMLMDFPCARISLLKKLEQKYRLFLLSNTNKIHHSEFARILKNEKIWNSWKALFEKKYYSHQLGMRKPDREIFEYVLTENRLDASETLFIDDSEPNIIGAQKAGLNTYFLKKGEDILSLSL